MLSFFARGCSIALLFFAWVATAFAAPTAPSGLNTVSLTATSFTLRWSAATGGSGGIAGYDIYRDGSLLGSTIATVRTIAVTGLAPTTIYSMTVIARDGGGSFSPASAALLVTTPADTTVPTRPADLAATAITPSSCSLIWTASTDNVGVTGYNIYRSGVLLGSATGTSFDVTGLAPDSNHSITVRATDAAGNLSATSVALTVRTMALPPSAPTGLAATALKATSFTLTWAAATGGTGGIAGYDVSRDGTLIGSTTTGRTFAVTGLSPTTTYQMTVISRDSTGNVSPASVALEVTTPVDTTVPTRPADLASANVTTTSFTLTWMGSTDNVGVTGYNIYRSGVQLGTTSGTSYQVTGLIPDSTNNITVRALDAAGNLSAASVALSVRMEALPPSTPTGLTVAALRPSSFTLQWSASTGGTGGIKGYEVYVNGVLVGSPTTRSLAVSGLVPQTAYSMTVTSHDSIGNISPSSEPLVVSTPADTTKPTVPKGLSADQVTPTGFTLMWTASTDNVGVIGYDVYRNNLLIGSTPAPIFVVTGLARLTLSSMRVKAKDAAGNISGFSAILPVTTSALPNVLPTITLKSPADGSNFTLPFTLTLSATATDSDGTITNVEFFDNGSYLGETAVPVSGQSGIWLLTLSSPLTAGSHSLTARATDNSNATADSNAVAITVKNPNSSPIVTITAPTNETGLVAPGFVTIAADATDSDGTITKVDFYEGDNLLGTVLAPTTPPSTFTFPLTLYSTGTYTLKAVATDNSTAQASSASVVVEVSSGAAELPYVANFEPTEGYRLGPLTGQLSWVATGGVTIAPSVTPGSQQELAIPAAQPAEILSRDFSAAGVSPVFVDFHARPVAGATPSSAMIFSTPAAQVALVGTSSPADLWIFGGSGSGWQASGQTIATDGNGHTSEWIRLTTREDYLQKKWDLYLNGKMIAADVPFADANAASLTDFSVNGHAASASAFDSFYAGPENPLFADANHNGIDDVWEAAHGLLLANDNRQLSPSGNGVTVLRAYLNGTDPNDYYNGDNPIITVLAGGGGQPGLDGLLQVRIATASGQPLANAPVTFSISSGVSRLAASEDASAPLNGTLPCRSLADGTAAVYYRTAAGQSAEGAVTVQAGVATVQLVFQAQNTGENEPPVVAFTAPLDGATLNGSFGIILAASAYDFDGTVTKVEFYADSTKVGEVTTEPYYFIWTNPPIGSHELKAIATDNSGTKVTATAVAITVRPPAPATILYDFEAVEGFSPGLLDGQNGWGASGTESAWVTNETAQSGNQSVVILPPLGGGDVYSIGKQLTPLADGQTVRFIDFWIKPVADNSPYESSYVSLRYSPIIAFIRNGSMAELQAFETIGEGAPDIHWLSDLFVSVGEDGATTDWHRVTIRQDFGARRMDVFLDGQRALGDLPFNTLENDFSVFGHSNSPTRIDRFQILTDNPLFPDADSDGMDDAWEAAHGLSPGVNDRSDDLDHDGISNGDEFTLGLNPNGISSTSDGLPDKWKITHGFNSHIAIPPAQDTDGDGVPDIFEYRTGTDPRQMDSDGNGITDGEEDPDGDELTNAQEALQGTDPHDFYNGLIPVVTPLADFSNGFGPNGMIAVRVTTQSGTVLANAPVEFKTSDENLLTINPYGRGNVSSVVARADKLGVARVYVRPANQ